MSRSHLVTLVALVVVAAAFLLLLSTGFGRRRAAEEPDPLLLDVKLERLVRVAAREGADLPEQPTFMQVVCHVRFLAREGAPTAVFLPSGERGGYALAFIPKVRRVRGDLEFHAEQLNAEVSVHWRDELEGAPADDVWLYHSHESKTLITKVADGLVIAAPKSERPAKQVRAEVGYRVILRCDGPVAEARLKHVDWSVFDLDGEPLHLTNTAVPALMAAGVSHEAVRVIPDRLPASAGE